MVGDDEFSPIVFNIIRAFVEYNQNPQMFAQTIYQAKIISRNTELKSIETFCDLLIAYTYIQLEMYVKASSIIYKIIKTVKIQGMQLIEHFAWYLLGEINIREKKLDVAYGMLNNATIQLERQGKASDFILMLLKYSMFKIMMFTGNYNKAEICINQAKYLKRKYNLNFNFDVEPEHYPLYNQDNSDYPDENSQDIEIIEHPVEEEREEQ